MNSNSLKLGNIYSFEINEIPLSISERIEESGKENSNLLGLLEVVGNGRESDGIYFYIKGNNKGFCMNIDKGEKGELDKICKNTKSRNGDIDDGSENYLPINGQDENDTY